MSRLNRRSFLKTTAVGSLALTGCTAAKNNRQSLGVTTPRRGPNEELRVAVVGIRSQGFNHILVHAKEDNVRVVTICDVDENLFSERIKAVTDLGKPAPQTEYDVRRVIDDRDVDIVSIASPNHWHAPAAIWACQAGKDVYVQKPCCHNIVEGRRLVQAARKYKRIVQHGTQKRSCGFVREAMQLLKEGIIGEVYMSRGLCYKRRGSIGHCADGIGSDQAHQYILHGKPGKNYDKNYMSKVHYDLWLGPAPRRPFNYNRFHYNWHWNWDYGNGDVGNQGVHEMDVAMWGLGKDHEHPLKAHSMGGRYTYRDQGQTPNTLVSTFQYADRKMLVFEVRGRQTNKDWDTTIGNIFYGSKGYMAIRNNGYETVINGQPGPQVKGKIHSSDNFKNFHDAVRSRKVEDLNAEIDIAHHATTLCHLANISYRVGRSLEFDPKMETCGNDKEANALLTREYRKPFVIPDVV